MFYVIYQAFLFNEYSEYLTTEALEGFGDFKIGEVMRTVKYADDLVLLAREKRCYRI
jgi:hypothetical protein